MNKARIPTFHRTRHKRFSVLGKEKVSNHKRKKDEWAGPTVARVGLAEKVRTKRRHCGESVVGYLWEEHPGPEGTVEVTA